MPTKKKPQPEELDELIERCAGIDVGQAEVVVCARFLDEAGSRAKQIATFGTTTPDLLALSVTRYRKALTNERTSEVNRIHKTLEDAGVKLSSVATDVMGVSGRGMMRALIRRLRRPRGPGRPGQREAPGQAAGPPEGPHVPVPRPPRVLLERMLSHVDDLEADIAALTERIEAAVAPFEGRRFLLESIPGWANARLRSSWPRSGST